MFRFIRKHRLFFEILALIIFGMGSYFSFMDYFSVEYDNPVKHKRDLVGGIFFGVMAIIKLSEVIESIRNMNRDETK